MREKRLTCCASFGYLTPTGPYNKLGLNLSLHPGRGEGFEGGQGVHTHTHTHTNVDEIQGIVYAETFL